MPNKRASFSTTTSFFVGVSADDNVGVTAPLLPRLWKTARVHSVNCWGDGRIVGPASVAEPLSSHFGRRGGEKRTEPHQHTRVSLLMTQLKMRAFFPFLTIATIPVAARLRCVQVAVEKFVDMRDFEVS